MRRSGVTRMQRVLTAAKRAEMTELGRVRSQAERARAHAAALRAGVRGMAAGTGSADMRAISDWQAHAERAARAAEAAAAALDAEIRVLEAKFARTLGRENVVNGIVARHVEADRRLAERRAEGVPMRRQS